MKLSAMVLASGLVLLQLAVVTRAGEDVDAVLCADGIIRGGVCCAAGCGICGGCGCAERPGGPNDCCPGTIHENGILCVVSSDVGCVCDQEFVQPQARQDCDEDEPDTLAPNQAPTDLTQPPSAASDQPSAAPSATPTTSPSKAPTAASEQPSSAPSGAPSKSPTAASEQPSSAPSAAPSKSPTAASEQPSAAPSAAPTTSPSKSPTAASEQPSSAPSAAPSKSPTAATEQPSSAPSAIPSGSPSKSPTAAPMDAGICIADAMVTHSGGPSEAAGNSEYSVEVEIEACAGVALGSSSCLEDPAGGTNVCAAAGGACVKVTVTELLSCGAGGDMNGLGATDATTATGFAGVMCELADVYDAGQPTSDCLGNDAFAADYDTQCNAAKKDSKVNFQSLCEDSSTSFADGDGGVRCTFERNNNALESRQAIIRVCFDSVADAEAYAASGAEVGIRAQRTGPGNGASFKSCAAMCEPGA